MEVLCRKYAFPIERHSRPVTSFNSPYLPELGSPIFGNELNTDQTNILVYLRFAKTILSDYVNYIYTIHLVFSLRVALAHIWQRTFVTKSDYLIGHKCITQL